MNCENCKTDIDEKFKAAIRNNKCPACDHAIMPTEKLASLISLKILLGNFKDLDVDKVASSIVANFDLKQVFKEELVKETKKGYVPDEEKINSEVEEHLLEVEDKNKIDDNEYKKKQLAESKKVLQQMRDEAMTEAMAEQWGLGNANAFVDGENIREIVNSEKRTMSQENILTGTKGAFRRT
jgi:hypothetical protein